MNCEIDNTKNVKVMIFEAQDRSAETQKQMIDDVCRYLDKGWKMLESWSFSPNYRCVLYWPEYRQNEKNQGRENETT